MHSEQEPAASGVGALRKHALEIIRAELKEIYSGRVDPYEHATMTYGALFMAWRLALVSDIEYDEFETLINRGSRQPALRRG